MRLHLNKRRWVGAFLAEEASDERGCGEFRLESSSVCPESVTPIRQWWEKGQRRVGSDHAGSGAATMLRNIKEAAEVGKLREHPRPDVKDHSRGSQRALRWWPAAVQLRTGWRMRGRGVDSR